MNTIDKKIKAFQNRYNNIYQQVRGASVSSHNYTGLKNKRTK